MVPRTHAPHSESTTGDNPAPLQGQSASPFQVAVDLANELSRRYEIASLSGLLATAAASIAQNEISVAVFGRFKAGKSSFLNDFIGREILPVGVVPVTAVVTEISYGTEQRAGTVPKRADS